MAIHFDEKNQILTLHTKRTTYQMKIDAYGMLLHLYYGPRCEGTMDYLLTYYDRSGFSGNIYDAGNNRGYSMDSLPQEFPSCGSGDFRSAAVIIKTLDGFFNCDLRYSEHKIYKGKYGLTGLPAVYADSREADTLEIVLKDEVMKVKAVLYYGVIEEKDIITRSVKLINEGGQKIYVEKLDSACLDFLYGNYDVISFYGRHAMERNFQRMPIGHGSFSIGSRRGTSSHQYNPALILAEHETTEDFGTCYGMVYVYSGGFKAEVSLEQYDQIRMMMGFQEDMFSYPLEPGESLTAPEVVLSCSTAGLAGLSHNFHWCFRNHLCRGKYKNAVRPVLINSWEAFYFDFDGDALYELAKKAAASGIEMLVLDDGWFGQRNDDNCALGDWVVNEKKLGGTLQKLIEKIHGLGLKFGLWIEPEMISEDSELYRAHPDWALRIPGKKPVRGRNQLVLDFSRKEIVDYIYEKICGVLDQGQVEYLKWDMNRSITDVYSHGPKEQGRVLHDYVLGVYDLLERLIGRYPDMLIEGCSGGGGRFDAGMLYYTPQIWCSDNTDAVDRIRIQYGTSFVYPISAVGSHVSIVPNHQTGRSVSLETRAAVAMAGTFGYELDLNKITEDEARKLRNQIRDYHRFAPLIQNGLYYRLTNPYDRAVGAWSFVSEDGSEVMMEAVALETHGNMNVNYIRLKGLDENSVYEDMQSGRRYSGAALMHAGLVLPVKMEEYPSYIYYFRRVGA